MADCIIIGSGLVGSAMAIALAQAGLTVALIDTQDPARHVADAYDGRASAISLGSRRILASIGVWDTIEAACPIYDIHACDRFSPLHVHYDHRDVGSEPFGHIIENNRLRAALYRAVRAEKGIAWHAPATAADIVRDSNGVQVTLASGELLHAPLLLVADGKMSTTRARLGIEARITDYGQTAMVCTITHSKPHQGLALERFLAPGPFAALPMTDDASGNPRSNIVWTESDAMAVRMMQLSEAEFMRELASRLGSYLGDVALTGPRFTYPLKLILAERYTDQRVALIGDSAHGIHPIAGQGVNLGYRDVAALAELIVDHARLGLDIGSATLLAHYARWRSFDATSTAMVMDGINRLFSNNILPIRIARNLGLGAVNQIGPLKRFLMQDAMGLTGDLPRMMREHAA